MSSKIVSKKLIIIVPILFFIIALVRVYINYNENKNNVRNFIFEQSKLVDSLYMTHRSYYQSLYVKNIIKLDSETIKGLPAYSAKPISNAFSKNNALHVEMYTVSDRARNPINQADEFEMKAINYFKNNKNSEVYFNKEDTFYQYAKALRIEQKCLRCHGKKEDAPKFISQRYDKAYDYKVGDIRGILSIKTPMKYINKVFDKQFYGSLLYDFILISMVSIIAFYMLRFLSSLNINLEKELDIRTDELKNVSLFDNLTKLKNRTSLVQTIEESKNISLVLVNIDTFSQINDFYGHDFGDAVLVEFANKLQKVCIEDEKIKLFRVSGDEFVILMLNMQSHNVVLKVQEISKTINSNKYEVDNEVVGLNTTISISFEEKDKLLMTADMALKIARRESKNIIVYDNTMSLNKEYENNMLWTKKIKKAIKEDKIVLYYQAIVDNKNQKVKKYESLIRLIDEEGKVISPYFFLDIAKKSKLYKKLTKIVIQKSFDMFRDSDAEFSVNLSIDDILDKEIYNYILKMLAIYHVSDRVIFEIVESESIENFEEIQKFINSVKVLGCRIAIDDFGTGYSNFEYLMRLEPDFIKIDGSIVKEILTDKNSEIIISVIIDFAKKMDIKVIAEFVENEEVFNKIKELGIDYTQGYYFSKPNANLI